MLKILLPTCCIFLATSLNAAADDIAVSSSFGSSSAISNEASNTLAYTVTEITLPEITRSFVDRFSQSPDGSIMISFGQGSAIKPAGESWIIAPEGFIARYSTQTGYLAGEDSNSGQAAFWAPITGASNYELILGSGFRYNVRGLAEDGSVLLKPSNAGADQSMIYKDGQLTSLDEQGYSFDLDGLFPVRMLPSGAIHGVYLKDAETIHPFAITDGELSINETITLSTTQADEIDDISENGHVITRSDGSAVELFGPDINGIQIIEQFSAVSINNLGYAVGEIPGVSHDTALLWRPEFGLRELDSFTPASATPLIDARSIQSNLSLLAISIDAEIRYHLYRLTVDDSFSAASIDVTTTLETEFFKIAVETNFDAQDVILQQRSGSGNWSDVDAEPTHLEEDSYLFEIPIPSSGFLLRVIATREG